MSVTFDVTANVGLITLDRAESHNALDVNTARDLFGGLLRASSDAAVRCVVLTGAGKSFCVGGDLKWVAAHPLGMPAAFHELAAHVNMSIIEICRMPKPVIAAVNGMAAGGGFSLALACDFRVMADSAMLRQGYTSNGLCIDAAGTFMLPRLIGHARAMEIAAFDEPIDAAHALAWGLATSVVPLARLRDESIAMAKRLAERSINAFALVKELLIDKSLESRLEAERQGIARSAMHPEGIEGVNAFLEKRAPNYRAAPR